MDASKENCQKAVDLFGLDDMDVDQKFAREFVSEFLKAALRRLPSQASIDKDRARRKILKSNASQEVQDAAEKGFNS